LNVTVKKKNKIGIQKEQNFNIIKTEKKEIINNKPSQSFKSSISKFEQSTSTKTKVTGNDQDYKSFSKYSKEYSVDQEMKVEDYDVNYIKKCNNIINLVQEQIPCRAIQNLLSFHPEIVESILVPQIKNHYIKLANHKFSNYFLQKIILYMNETSLIDLYFQVSNFLTILIIRLNRIYLN
jgi:hypothetical protein